MLKLSDIVIDTEFKTLLPPLTEDERLNLVKSIAADGFRDQITVWRGTLIDGHNRYEIWQTAFSGNEADGPDIRTVEFRDRSEAMRWILRNQLGRRNLTDAARVQAALKLEPLISAKAKENQRAAGGNHNAVVDSVQRPEAEGKALCLNSDKALPAKVDSLAEVAEIAGVSRDTVSKVKTVLRAGDKETADKMVAGEISIHAAHQRVKANPTTPAETTAPTKKFKPLSDRDVHLARMDVRKTVIGLMNRVKRTSKQAMQVMPELCRELREMSQELCTLADGIDAGEWGGPTE